MTPRSIATSAHKAGVLAFERSSPSDLGDDPRPAVLHEPPQIHAHELVEGLHELRGPVGFPRLGDVLIDDVPGESVEEVAASEALSDHVLVVDPHIDEDADVLASKVGDDLGHGQTSIAQSEQLHPNLALNSA